MNFENRKFLLIVFPISILYNFFVLKKPLKNDISTTFFLLYFGLTFALDIIRKEIFSDGYNLFLSATFLIYLSQLHISVKSHNNLNKYITIVVYLSFIVILIQGVLNPTFFVPDQWAHRLIENTTSYEQRLPSIYAWISFTAMLFTFPPFLSIVINENANKNRFLHLIILSIIGIIFAFLTKGRSTLIYILIIHLQLLSKVKLKFSQLILRGVLVLIGISISIYVMNILNIPVSEIFTYRYMEEGREFEQTTAYARIDNLYFFSQNFENFWTIGAGNNIDIFFQSEMDRSSNAMIIGILDPIFRYGLIISLFYYIFIVLAAKRFYQTAKITNNWGLFWGFIGFIIMNIFSNAFYIFHFGIMFLFVYEKFYREQFKIKTIESYQFFA